MWNPDYKYHLISRQKHLLLLRQGGPEKIALSIAYYKTHPVEFIEHWCVTFDPRNAGSDKPTNMPFVLFPKQKEFVIFLQECIIKKEASALIEKARDMGATWLCCAFSVWLWLFYPGASVGWGSRKSNLVDLIGIVDSIFEKMRVIIRHLPPEYWPRGFAIKDHMPFMRIINPENGSTIIGETGDEIGRGGRTLVYFKDEAAHYERPELIEAALSGNTNIQIDISSVNGTGNVFYRRREAGLDYNPANGVDKNRVNVFVFDWRDNPLKSQEWYDRERAKKESEGLLHIFMQEVERNYSASIEGIIIPADWVKAAIDSHIKLGTGESGPWVGALDVADGGGDTNALSLRHGVVLKAVDEWTVRDTGMTARKAVAACRGHGPVDLNYDCIGIGSGIKAETNRLIDDGLMPKDITLIPWNAGERPMYPDRRVIQDDRNTPYNKDFYQNVKAQGWWQLRRRFEITYRAINDPTFTYEPDDLISLSSELPLLHKIVKELSQPTMGKSSSLKLIVDKMPQGSKSPNLADSIMMNYWPMVSNKPMKISDDFLNRLGGMSLQRNKL